jgi:hypothetical protein
LIYIYIYTHILERLIYIYTSLFGAALQPWMFGGIARTFQKCATEDGNFMQMAEYILSRSGVEDFGFFVQLARQVWFRRNKWVNEGMFISPNDINKWCRGE